MPFIKCPTCGAPPGLWSLDSPESPIGFLVDAHFMCKECYLKHTSRVVPIPVYPANILPYKQSCTKCGKLVIRGDAPEPELFNNPYDHDHAGEEPGFTADFSFREEVVGDKEEESDPHNILGIEARERMIAYYNTHKHWNSSTAHLTDQIFSILEPFMGKGRLPVHIKRRVLAILDHATNGNPES